jgi:ribonuclease HII
MDGEVCMTIFRMREPGDRPDLSFEQPLWLAGCSAVAGIDEAGRGALAGPVTAAAVIFRPEPDLTNRLWGVRDSKQMTSTQRVYWANAIQHLAAAWAVGWAAAFEIDELGILPATRLAAQRALATLHIPIHHLLLDWIFLPEYELPQTAFAKGDQRSLSIAAASVLAKTSRDAHMQALEADYPGYGLALHKGYGTTRHLAALHRLGPTPIHRFSFQPVRELSAPLFT